MENEKQKTFGSEDNNVLDKLLKVPTYTLGIFSIDVQKRLLSAKGDVKKLTNKELHLLVVLAANPNTMLERKFLLESIWQENNYFNGRSMDVYLCKLRKLLAADQKLNIVNIHGKGYKLIVPN
jgi:two-component system, OmpR family, response regulator